MTSAVGIERSLKLQTLVVCSGAMRCVGFLDLLVLK